MDLKKGFIDIIFCLSIVFIIFYATTFEFGKYLFAGDFRLAIYKSVIRDQFLSLVSSKFSNNNFIYLSFYPLFLFFSMIPYSWVVTFIFFGIPILLFQSAKFTILQFVNYKKTDILHYVLISSVSFFYALNPWFFNRYVHYTMPYSAIFFPLVIWALYKYLTGYSYFGKYLMLFFIFYYLGSIGPQPTVIFACTYLFFVAGIGISKIAEIKKYFVKIAFSFAAVVLSLSHIIIPAFTGHAVAKSFLESSTEPNILLSLGRNSTLITAISGTNFFERLIIFPSYLSVAILFFLFVVLIFFFVKKSAIHFLLITYMMILLIVGSGFRTFRPVFEIVMATPFKNYLWLVKDPNTYYLFFLFPLLLLFVLLLKEIKPPRTLIVLIIFIAICGNLLFIFNSDYTDYKKYFKFINVPAEYQSLSISLKGDKGRNLWIPSSQYVGKNFTTGQTHFPSPSIWLTQNKESTYYASEYRQLNALIENEIVSNNCSNRNFLNWIISAQNLNIILDKNSVNNPLLEDSTTESIVKKTSDCLVTLKNVYKYKHFGNIEVYKSNLKIDNNFVSISGDIKFLNDFLKNNTPNILFINSKQKKAVRLTGNFSVLNESYDTNWRNGHGEGPVGKVNFASMLFNQKIGDFHYKDENVFTTITFLQKILLALSVTYLLFLAVNFKGIQKSKKTK